MNERAASAVASAASTVAGLLGAAGPLAALLDGFQPRQEQQEMAAAIATTLARREILICEAGTGTGKTFAYLVPALNSGLKTIISTATKALQDQLFHRDLPLVRRALAAPGEIALLKGRQNYVCRLRLERAVGSPELETRRLGQVAHIQRWAEHSDSGDLEELPEIDDDRELRYLVTSTADNCLGQDCALFDACFVVRARRAAANADLVVVNHHLLFADMVLRESGFAELLPSAEAIILDEAHKLPEIASTFFSQAISAQHLSLLCRDTLAAAATEARDMPGLERCTRVLDAAQAEFKRALGPTSRRVDWRAVSGEQAMAGHLATLDLALADLVEQLAQAAQRGPLLQHCHDRALDLRARWAVFSAGDDATRVRWLDVGARNFTLYDTPVSVAGEFQARVAASGAAWVMTSATLAVDGHFDHFRTALGLHEAREALWLSPFDYAQQSLLYLPELALEPGAPGFEEALVAAALPVLEASRGRAFFLFTSYRSLDLCAGLLRAHGGFPLLIQGDAPPSDLLRRFRAQDSAVLLGTATFWEGVDVRGEELSLVIIDKLPFGVPDDPVTKARAAALTAAGENPFMQLHLPAAVTALKQGAGRLIRDELDRGVLMIGDVRIRRRSYGRVFLDSLPPMPQTSSLEQVRRFFA